MRLTGVVVFTLLSALSTVSAQSLGAVARKEKERRESNRREGATVRVITDSDVRSAPAPLPQGEGVASETPAVDLGDEATPLAPEFRLSDRNGRAVSLSSLRGRPVLLDFWATWCGPCRATMPEIQKLHRAYGGRLHAVGINIEGRSAEVLDYLNQGQYSFDVLFDEGNFEAPTARS